MGFSSSDTYLGIDIGSSSVKLVELKKEKGRLRLFTYGYTEDIDQTEKNDWKNETDYMARVLRKLMNESGVTCENAVSALPAFSVFSSIINLSNVGRKEISSAVHWEAKKVIPLPLDDMVLDWKVIENEETSANRNDVKVLLTGAPKNLVKKHLDIFKEAKINLLSLETETFSLIRSLVGGDNTTIMVVEMGMSTTDISIIKAGIPVLNRSIDLGGLSITKAISKNLNIGLNRAEQFKCDLGLDLSDAGRGVIPKAIIDTLNPAINEMRYMINLFKNKNEEAVEKIVLSGGSSMLPHLNEYLSKILNINVVIGDPWARVSYPLELKPVLDEVGPKMSVAVGLAIRDME